MPLHIANTFTGALAKLQNREQKAVKLTVYDFQTDSGQAGLRYHKIDKGRDPNFRSVSVNMDLRIIVHQQGASTLLCYVDHHDKAYAWAERRKLEVHPKTGAAQIVEVVERVEEVAGEPPVTKAEAPAPQPTQAEGRPPREAPTDARSRPPLADYTDDWLLEYGVPAEWLQRLKRADEDQLLELAMHLPEEAQEIVLTIATGKVPDKPTSTTSSTDPLDHPDAQRRFRRIDSKEELAAALDAPFDTWRIFLHPQQRALVSKDYAGPARVAGSAGTGKTVVALHRAADLLRRNPDYQVLLTTFSPALANALRQTFKLLIAHEPQLMDRTRIQSLDVTAERLYRLRGGPNTLIDEAELRELVLAKAKEASLSFPAGFVYREWSEVVDAWQLYTWEDYRDVPRVGRGAPLALAKREKLWTFFDAVRKYLLGKGLATISDAYGWLTARFSDGTVPSPYTHVVVDEAQDLSVAQLRFLAVLAQKHADGLFFAGDLGQRIFRAPFSWSSLGINVRGRSTTLRINYRTSRQIRSQADRLLDPEIADVDGNLEKRNNAQSVFNGEVPQIIRADSFADELTIVADWITSCLNDDIPAEQIAVFVRAAGQLSRAHATVALAGEEACQLDADLRTSEGCVTVSTMHLAKGLEFRAVAVMALDEDVIPDPDRLAAAVDQSQIQDIYDTERQLLYVAATRARDRLILTCADYPSEFLADLIG